MALVFSVFVIVVIKWILLRKAVLQMLLMAQRWYCVEKRKLPTSQILSLKNDLGEIDYECEEIRGIPYPIYFAYIFYICTRMKVYDNQCVSLKALQVGETKTF